MKKKVFNIILFVAVLFAAGNLFWQKNNGRHSEVKEFTAFFNVPGTTQNEDSAVKKKIAEITGAKCQEIWLVGQTADEAIASYIASGEYPDFISGNATLYEAGALLPIDEYWEEYPNIQNYMPEEAWDKLRQKDGHIYWIPQFGVTRGETTEVLHEGEAFWIQTRVLKWAGYPKITTVEKYFALIEDYMKENPRMENGEDNIPFTILCDDWRYFCLENPPQFLDGYPNDGSCMVNPDTLTVMDYNVTETAKNYFKKLNQEYHAGMIDAESFTQTYDEYLDKLASGRVLGMIDQWWQFSYDVNDSLDYISEQGCHYVPLPITMEEGTKNQWHVKRGNEFNVADGISITVDCKDVAGAMQFLNDLLEEEMIRLRFWGIEGEDYEVNENGVFYKTEEQRKKAGDAAYQSSQFCFYSYFPRLEGISADGINAFSPEYQPGEFFAALPQDVKDCLTAYGCKNYVDMLGTNEKPGSWYPMYSYTNAMTAETAAGRAWKEMTEVKQEYLPQVIMSNDFEGMWEQYMDNYEACHPEVFFEEMQQELNRRIK